MASTNIQLYKGVLIALEDNGIFFAYWYGVRIEHRTLTGVRKKLRQAESRKVTPIKVCTFTAFSSITERIYEGVSHDGKLILSPKLDAHESISLTDVYYPDPILMEMDRQVKEEIAELHKQKKILENKSTQIRKQFKRIPQELLAGEEIKEEPSEV